MDDVKYTVRINYKSGNHRFVKWCDEQWFETTHKPNYTLSMHQAEQICFLMGKHYVKNMSILGTDGSTKEMGWANRNNRKPTMVEKEKVRKNLFSLNKAMLK